MKLLQRLNLKSFLKSFLRPFLQSCILVGCLLTWMDASAQTAEEIVKSATCTNAGCHGGATGAVSSLEAAKARVLATTNPMPPGGASAEMKAAFEKVGAAPPQDQVTNKPPPKPSDSGAQPSMSNTNSVGQATKPNPHAQQNGAQSGSQNSGGTQNAPKPKPKLPSATAGSKTPLLLDLNGDGEFRPISEEISFDLLGSKRSYVKEWHRRGDAWLCIDLDGNGKIDSGRELFGDLSPAPKSQAGLVFADGFSALAVHDTNADNRIDRLDSAYAQLRVWNDHNRNGVSESAELSSLLSRGIEVIELSARDDSHPRVVKLGRFLHNGKWKLVADVLIEFSEEREVAAK